MENLKVLRKLETYELNKNRVTTATNCLLTLRLRSKIDLFANLGKLRDAIQTFKEMHVLLRAKVVKIEDDFHFVIDENSSMNRNLENVHFLLIKSNLNDPELTKSLIDDHLLFDLVLEKTLSELFDCEKPHESLWKLIILEINNSSDNERVYEFVWNFHHIIADGISIKANFPYLLNVIDKTLKGEDVEIKEYGMYPGTTHLFEKEMNSEVKNSEPLPKIFVPEFVNPDKAKISSQTFVDKYLSGGKDVNQLDFELIDLNSGSTYSTLSKLVHISKEISNNKPINFVIGEDKFVKLLKKSKSEGIKMTTCVNMIGVLATLKLFKKEKINLDEIILYTAINLRQFHSPPIDEFQFGYCVGALTSLIRNDFKDVNDDEELKANFWQFAKKNAQLFDDRVKNDNQKFVNPQFRKFEPNEMLFYIGMSNLGVMETSKYECFSSNKGPFTIENSFTICYFGSQVNKCPICCYLCTVNNKLCISSNFNSYFFDYSLVEEFVAYFKDIVDKLVN